MKVFALEVKSDKSCCLRTCRTIKLEPEASLRTCKAVVDFVNTKFRARRLAEEHIWLLGFDSALHPVGAFELSHGVCDASLASPREVLIRLLLCGAVSWIMVHNHPNGTTRPTNADKVVTSEMAAASKLINIKLLDHIIIGNGYYSFAEEGSLTDGEFNNNKDQVFLK